jgi:hypothetical protein
VNPFGPGTKHIIPKLDCVEEVDPPVEGFDYVAHFSYQNNNSVGVYIFKGPDNELSSDNGDDAFYGENQPELFLSGGGAFSVPFDGVDLKWILASYNHKGQKTSNSVKATSNSGGCNKSASAGSETEGIYAYPNPVSGMLNVQLTASLDADHISVYDMNGHHHQLNIKHRNLNLIAVDFSDLNNGIYLIKLDMETEVKLLRVIKR